MKKLPKVPISIGELVDKITILEIKKERINKESKASNVDKELSYLKETLSSLSVDGPLVDPFYRRLKEVNEEIWNAQERINAAINSDKFDASVLPESRAVFIKNNERAAIKKEINSAFSSDLIEEKSFL